MNAFGLHKSPYDPRDYLISSYLEDKPLPKRYDLTDKMTPVRSQRNEGSCTGFAIATGVMEYLNNVIDYPEYKSLITLSPRLVYEEAKKISGHREGTTLKAAVQAAQKMGTCLERYWPYIPKKPSEPLDGAYENAGRFRIGSYGRITCLAELKLALIQFGPPLLGIMVWKSIKKTGKDGIVPTPKMWLPSNWRPIAAHAICPVGYDDDTKLLKFKNSWGNWGQDGFGYLSYEYVNDHVLDGFSIVDIDDPNPYRMGDLIPEERAVLWGSS